MESLPVELMVLTLSQVEDVPTLSALIHASPIFHAVYASCRSRIFTEITLRSLIARGIEFVRPFQWAEVCFKAGEGARVVRIEERVILQRAFKALNGYFGRRSPMPLILDIDQCQLLSKIAHMNVCTIDNNADNFEDALETSTSGQSLPTHPSLHMPDILKMSKKANNGWGSIHYPCGFSRYRTIAVKEFSSWQWTSLLHYEIVHQFECEAFG